MKKIYIVGGGTAGWFTALIAKKFNPSYEITLIESSEIGVLGAGEGSVPFFVNVLDFLEIPVTDLIKECKATFKLGINFQDFNGDGESYFHSFIYKGDIDNPIPIDQSLKDRILELQRDIAAGQSESMYERMAKENKIPFTWDDKSTPLDKLPLNHYGQFSLHFDARLLAVYLTRIAGERGIKRIDSKVASFKGDQIITDIVLEDGTNLPCDFVFDCSGFARLIIGKHHKTKWLSYQHHSGLNSAFPFFIEHDNNISPVTDAICMSAGWMWRIPVQGRYGCGYVYDSSYISDEDAKKEAEAWAGKKIESTKVFRFDAGTYERSLVGNSMAVGLSQGFLEPLEATNIWVSCLNVIDFFNSDGVNEKDQNFIEEFNARVLKRNQNVLEFVYLHYMTSRKDHPFWREFQEKHPIPERLGVMLDQLNAGKNPDIDFGMFTDRSWMQVLHGLRLVDFDKYVDTFIDFHMPSLLTTNKYAKINEFVSHKDIIEHFENLSNLPK